jgi:SAM-dependent methyltransferase
LRVDPAFMTIVQRGLLTGRARLLDLGCGQGLLSAWLRAAHICHARGLWPENWPPPPTPISVHGIEMTPLDVERARHALLRPPPGDMKLEFVAGDIRSAELQPADAIVILDVLHYIPRPAQEQVLRRVRAALAPGALLLTRIGDAGGGLPYCFSTWVDKAVLLARGRGLQPLYCRPLSDWLRLLTECGFETQTIPMRAGTPFANVMLLAEAR